MLNAKDPLILFNTWFTSAMQADPQANAMALATAGSDGKPSVRMVLLKQYDQHGFVFYTNLGSLKATQILENPYASCCFYWPALDKQVRIEGNVIPVSHTEADAYFQTRPRESQLSAWASEQSQKLEHYEDLLAKVKQLEKQFHHQSIPRPPFWSGLRIKPDKIEFWEAAPNRLHKRKVFQKQGSSWQTFMLNP